MAISSSQKSAMILIAIFGGSFVAGMLIGQASGLAFGSVESGQVFSFYEYRGGISRARVGIPGQNTTMEYNAGDEDTYLGNPYSSSQRATYAVTGVTPGPVSQVPELLPDIEVWNQFPYPSYQNGTYIPTGRSQYVYQKFTNVTIGGKPMLLVERQAFYTVIVAARTIGKASPKSPSPVTVSNVLGTINTVFGLINDGQYNDGTIGMFSYNNNDMIISAAPAKVSFDIDLALIDSSTRGETTTSADGNTTITYRDSWMGIYGVKVTSSSVGFVNTTDTTTMNNIRNKLPDDGTASLDMIDDRAYVDGSLDSSANGDGFPAAKPVQAINGQTIVFTETVLSTHSMPTYQAQYVTGTTVGQALVMNNVENIYLTPDGITYNKSLPVTIASSTNAYAAVRVSTYVLLQPKVRVYKTVLDWNTHQVTHKLPGILTQESWYDSATTAATASYCSGAYVEDVYYVTTVTFDTRSAKLYDVDTVIDENTPAWNYTGYNPNAFTGINPDGWEDPTGDTGVTLYQPPPTPIIVYIIWIIAIIAIVVVVYLVIKMVNKSGQQAMKARTGGMVE